jgi:hypothetical protein
VPEARGDQHGAQLRKKIVHGGVWEQRLC